MLSFRVRSLAASGWREITIEMRHACAAKSLRGVRRWNLDACVSFLPFDGVLERLSAGWTARHMGPDARACVMVRVRRAIEDTDGVYIHERLAFLNIISSYGGLIE